jgi:hypothetical protein
MWELYDLSKDFSESDNLAVKEAERRARRSTAPFKFDGRIENVTAELK